jgi:hypothetical protein
VDTSGTGDPVDPDRAPIFVLGSGRSGSTLLRAMLNAHPRIHLLQEASFLAWTQAWSPFRRTPAERLEFYLGSFSFAWLRLEPDEIRRRLPAPLSREDLLEAYRQIMQQKAAQFRKPRYGEKNPLLAGHLDLVFAKFPDARVIDIVRDPRAAVVSHTKMPFSTASRLLVTLHLRSNAKRMAAYRDRVLTVRMEDLIADSRSTMERVLDFVGEAWSDAVLDHARFAADDDGIPFPWLASARRKPTPRPEIWPAELSPAWIRIVEARNRDTMRDCDYPPARLDREPGLVEKARALLADAPEALRYVAHMLRVWRRFGGSSPPGPAEGQRILHDANPDAWACHPDWSLPDPPEPPGP